MQWPPGWRFSSSHGHRGSWKKTVASPPPKALKKFISWQPQEKDGKGDLNILMITWLLLLNCEQPCHCCLQIMLWTWFYLSRIISKVEETRRAVLVQKDFASPVVSAFVTARHFKHWILNSRNGTQIGIYIYSIYRYYRRYSGIIGKPIFYLKRVWTYNPTISRHWLLVKPGIFQATIDQYQEDSSLVPNLMEWVEPQARHRLQCWIQDHVNAFASQKCCEARNLLREMLWNVLKNRGNPGKPIEFRWKMVNATLEVVWWIWTLEVLGEHPFFLNMT